MKKIIFFVVSILIGLILFVIVIWKVGLQEILHTINYFSISKWFVILLLSATQFYITLFRWKLVLRSQGFKVPLIKLVASKLVGFSVDYTTPSPNVGGEAIRAYVLQKDTGIGFSQGLASIIIDKVMDFSYALPFVLFSIFYVLIKFSLPWKIMAGLLFVSFSFIFLILLFYYKTLRKKEFFGAIIRFLQLHRLSFVAGVMDKIAQFEQIIIDFFHRDKKTFYRGLILSLLGGIFAISGVWLILVFLGLTVNLLQVILIATLGIITFLLPIPGSFGSTETGEILIFSLFDFRPEYAIAYTLIFRSIDFLKVGVGFLFLSHFGLKIGQTIIRGGGVKLNKNNLEGQSKN